MTKMPHHCFFPGPFPVIEICGSRVNWKIQELTLNWLVIAWHQNMLFGKFLHYLFQLHMNFCTHHMNTTQNYMHTCNGNTVPEVTNRHNPHILNLHTFRSVCNICDKTFTHTSHIQNTHDMRALFQTLDTLQNIVG